MGIRIGKTIYYNTRPQRAYWATRNFLVKLTGRCPMCSLRHGDHKFSCYYR